jgi:hypothetical protein
LSSEAGSDFAGAGTEPTYEIKFFNLPLIRFVFDQCMLVLYFKLALFTPLPSERTAVFPSPGRLVQDSLFDVGLTFGLYLIWDWLSIWMARSRDNGKPRYPEIDNNRMTVPPKPRAPDYVGMFITLGALVLLALLATAASFETARGKPNVVLVLALTVVVSYRFAKECKASAKYPRTRPQAA